MLEQATSDKQASNKVDMNFTAEELIADYRLAFLSRQVSLLGRREVLTGKAKFGIFGDGKESVQLAMAKVFRAGDIRSGYYRDQTIAFAKGMSNVQEYFAQLYAHVDVSQDPASGGRQMNCHFATRWLDDNGEWNDLTQRPHSSADSSPTSSQMPRMLGLAYASKLFRLAPELQQFKQYSHNGDEIIFGSIGDASTSEGLFWETMNAAGVLQIPLLMSVYDDNYGISVPIKYQTTKCSISTLFQGFKPEGELDGIDVYVVKGWDYPALCATYFRAAEKVRKEQKPALIHVTELTQPQGHSTSGSHERYKSKERLEWEKEFDCLTQMREWLILQRLTTKDSLEKLEEDIKKEVGAARNLAWHNYLSSIKEEIIEVSSIFDRIAQESNQKEAILKIKSDLEKYAEPFRKDIMVAIRNVLLLSSGEEHIGFRKTLLNWKKQEDAKNFARYSSHLVSESAQSAFKVKEVKATYDANPKIVDGRQVLGAFFDLALARDPKVIAFGEDVGFLGDVNQAFAGMQQKYGELRVTDTGIREATIIGQGIGMAMRGLRPIAEIQYLDYLMYALQIMSDDLCTLHWRTKGGQKAPLIIRTRGHRLEGVWHSGSLMGAIIHACRGLHVLVPRNMTQAAGFYNTLLQSDDPALIVEVLNGYRLKEEMPNNLDQFTVPIGVTETLLEGGDITLVTYGPNCRIALEVAQLLKPLDIHLEVIDAQSLLPFDIRHNIKTSLMKTNRLIVMDEDVPGGTSAYILQQILETQGGFRYLDSAPRTLAGKEHRPAYGTDGDYFSKPNHELLLELCVEIMHESNPKKYPKILG